MSYQVPRGTQDILPNEISKWHRLEELIRQFTYVYNYQEIRTPIFEHTNVFKRGMIPVIWSIRKCTPSSWKTAPLH